jgi:hypothetical protein
VSELFEFFGAAHVVHVEVCEDDDFDVCGLVTQLLDVGDDFLGIPDVPVSMTVNSSPSIFR